MPTLLLAVGFSYVTINKFSYITRPSCKVFFTNLWNLTTIKNFHLFCFRLDTWLDKLKLAAHCFKFLLLHSLLISFFYNPLKGNVEIHYFIVQKLSDSQPDYKVDILLRHNFLVDTVHKYLSLHFFSYV